MIEENDPFMRTRLLIGEDALQRLHDAFVAVVGLGAVGGFATEALARSGVGRLRLIDGDTVSPSNINRQILALHSTVGQKKASLAARRVKDIYPDCDVDARPVFVHESELPDIFADKPDFVVDAIDSLTDKVNLIAFLRTNGIPFISCMGAAMRTDLTQIRIGTPDKVTHCPLTAAVRQRLRRRGVPLDFPCVYSCEPRDKLPKPVRPEGAGEKDRTVMGSLPSVTAVFGLTAAHHVIKTLTGLD